MKKKKVMCEEDYVEEYKQVISAVIFFYGLIFIGFLVAFI